ncbi:MAG: hypothetical protein EBV45_14645, partial [Chloroflexi bacterium]|nr:hypothetical protein [Chloroflexota bacterium]
MDDLPRNLDGHANDIRFRLSDQLGTVNARLHRHLHGNLKVTRNFGKPLGMPFGSPLFPRRLNLCFLLSQKAPRLLQGVDRLPCLINASLGLSDGLGNLRLRVSDQRLRVGVRLQPLSSRLP